MSQFRDNAAARRFEWEEEGVLSIADYVERDGVRAITHVETPPEARGRGYAARLMDALIAEARARGFKLRPICPCAVAHFRRHPATQDVLA